MLSGKHINDEEGHADYKSMLQWASLFPELSLSLSQPWTHLLCHRCTASRFLLRVSRLSSGVSSNHAISSLWVRILNFMKLFTQLSCEGKHPSFHQIICASIQTIILPCHWRSSFFRRLAVESVPTSEIESNWTVTVRLMEDHRCVYIWITTWFSPAHVRSVGSSVFSPLSLSAQCRRTPGYNEKNTETRFLLICIYK